MIAIGLVPISLSMLWIPPGAIWSSMKGKVFNYVEIDSTFYNNPRELMVRNWNRRTPDNFRFTAKFPKIIAS